MMSIRAKQTPTFTKFTIFATVHIGTESRCSLRTVSFDLLWFTQMVQEARKKKEETCKLGRGVVIIVIGYCQRYGTVYTKHAEFATWFKLMM